MKLDYKKIYDQYMKLPYYLRDGDIFGIGHRIYFADLEKEYIEELNFLAKKKFPKRKKVDYTVLTEEEIKPVEEKYQKWIVSIWRRKTSQAEKLKNLLYSIADTVDIVSSDGFHMIESSRGSSYRSQGWGKNKYAEKYLDKYLNILAIHKIECEIRHVPEWNSAPCDSYEYQLWAKIEPWVWDALTRITKYSVSDWAVSCWENGVNPKVYNQFLDDKVYDESMEIYMKRNSK